MSPGLGSTGLLPLGDHGSAARVADAFGPRLAQALVTAMAPAPAKEAEPATQREHHRQPRSEMESASRLETESKLVPSRLLLAQWT